MTYLSDDARLSYQEIGTERSGGLPIVFLHPTPANGDFWQPLLAKLPGVRAIVADLRGHGRSELGTHLPAGDFERIPDAPVLAMSQLGSDILALLDHLQLQRAVFVGCSIGGYVLLELWRRAPERMRGLAFICSKPQPDVEANFVKREGNIAQARSGNLEALLDGMAQGMVAPSTRAQHPEVVSELRAQMTITAAGLVAVQAGLAVRPDSIPTVASITVPVLAVAGSEDVSVTPTEMEAFCAAPGGCTLRIVTDAGHAAAYERPQRVAAIMAEWLRKFA